MLKKLVTFVELVHKTMKEADYEPVQEHFEIGDNIHLPAWQHPSYYHGPGHVYTIMYTGSSYTL